MNIGPSHHIHPTLQRSMSRRIPIQSSEYTDPYTFIQNVGVARELCVELRTAYRHKMAAELRRQEILANTYREPHAAFQQRMNANASNGLYEREAYRRETDRQMFTYEVCVDAVRQLNHLDHMLSTLIAELDESEFIYRMRTYDIHESIDRFVSSVNTLKSLIQRASPNQPHYLSIPNQDVLHSEIHGMAGGSIAREHLPLSNRELREERERAAHSYHLAHDDMDDISQLHDEDASLYEDPALHPIHNQDYNSLVSRRHNHRMDDTIEARF